MNAEIIDFEEVTDFITRDGLFIENHLFTCAKRLVHKYGLTAREALKTIKILEEIGYTYER
jgi:hypothetical protein